MSKRSANLSHSSPTTARKSTLLGLAAVLMWSASVGLMRSITELLGPLGGSAAIYTASAAFAIAAFGLKWRGISLVYLLGGGALFVGYEASLALAIGLAHSRELSLEVGMINYLWPSLTVVLAVVAKQQRGSWLLVPALMVCLVGIVLVMTGDGDWSPQMLWHNVQSNPLAYSLALGAAFLWALYSLIARKFGNGANAVPAFLLATAILLWTKYAFSDEPALSASWPAALQLIAMGLLTAAAYTCWDFAVQRGNLTVLATISYFTPVFSMLLASVWLGVHIGMGFLYGVLLVTAGSLACWWATRDR